MRPANPHHTKGRASVTVRMNSNRFNFSSTFRKPLRPSKQFNFAKKRAFFISIHKRKNSNERNSFLNSSLRNRNHQLQTRIKQHLKPRQTSKQSTSLRNGKGKAHTNSTTHSRPSKTVKVSGETMTRSPKSGKDTVGKKQKKSQKQSSPKKKDQGHHFKCLPKIVASMYNECLRGDAQKMALIEELGFGAFSHLPSYNLKQHMLKELVNIFNIHENTYTLFVETLRSQQTR
ncbi:hypothetical protein PIB30_025529 [Stylosanthes scabra]|uniref:Uncharacterized protein n=1 Tax=Stylosanthes scabra TaxID=79078 RepID=A0ABU6Z6T4_9FABA|nr:hypothetical protein [Stylosanthes scabra]